MKNQNIASWAEIVKLELRVAELETAFRHHHVNNGEVGNDLCKTCKLDVRDAIHVRLPNPYKEQKGQVTQ